MLDETYYRTTDEIIARYGKKDSALIPIMQDIQTQYRYLPGELLSYVASQIGITETKAYSVATFYENFSFEAKGKYVIKVCDGHSLPRPSIHPGTGSAMEGAGSQQKKTHNGRHDVHC